MYSAFAPYEYFEDEESEEGQVQNVVNNQPVETPAGLNMNNVGVAAAKLLLNEQEIQPIMLVMYKEFQMKKKLKKMKKFKVYQITLILKIERERK